MVRSSGEASLDTTADRSAVSTRSDTPYLQQSPCSAFRIPQSAFYVPLSNKLTEHRRVNGNLDFSIRHRVLESFAITFELWEILIAQMICQLFGRFIQGGLVCLPIDHVHRSVRHPNQEIDHAFVPILGCLRPRKRKFGLEPESAPAQTL